MTRLPYYAGMRTHRAVIHISTRDGMLYRFTSDWLLNRQRAVALADEFEPTDGYGGITDTTIETKLNDS